MPIITSIRCFDGYPYRSLSPSLASDLERAAPVTGLRAVAVRGTLLRLECFLQVTDQTLRPSDLGGYKGTRKLAEFNAALFSSRFHSVVIPWQYPRFLRLPLEAICGSNFSYPPFPCTPNISGWPDSFRTAVDAFETSNLNLERVKFWNGWTCSNLKGEAFALCLWPIYDRFGPAFAEQLLNVARDWLRGRRANTVPGIREFVAFLSRLPKAPNVNDSEELGQLLIAFMEHYFTTRQASGTRLATSQKDWLCFASLLKEGLFGKSWAEPLPAMPEPHLKAPAAAMYNVRRTSNGLSVKQCLLTEIPLQVTDTQAKELLFKSIRTDFNNVMAWARAEVAAARDRCARRPVLARSGSPIEFSTQLGVNTGIRHKLSDKCELRMAHAAATFESRGFEHLRIGSASRLYPRPLDETAWELGLPTPLLLLAHSSVLVGEHPEITPSFLRELRLFDKHGAQTGLSYLDGGWYLIGHKMRKGPRKAEQRVRLTSETLAVVQDVIALTAPIRHWLREQGDDLWRRLFLSVPAMGNRPIAWRPSGVASRLVEPLALRISTQTKLGSEEAANLAKAFSLRRLRVSAGVIVYLDTGSVERMAKALGHDVYNPKLLDRYLPKPIQEFFVERWIRLFQTGIVCQALADSPWLLEASGFTSMSELDEFLENHAIRVIPAHLADPELYCGTDNLKAPESSVVFGVGVGILTMLISIQRAVALSDKEPCGRAIRWARISERLVAHLESQGDQPEFSDMARTAQRRADPALVEGLIYG